MHLVPRRSARSSSTAALVALSLLASLAAAPLSGCGSARELSKTPLLLAEEAIDPITWLFQNPESKIVNLLYATDRSVGYDPKRGVAYGFGRSKSMAFGECEVEIGKSIPWQRLVERSPRIRRRISLPLAVQSVNEKGRFPETPFPIVSGPSGIGDDPEVTSAHECMVSQFHSLLRSRLAAVERKDVFLFVHGYNNSFEDAAFTQAEIWQFLGRPGVPVIYSWPAGIGGIRGYTHDRESGEFTNFHFKQFLRMLAASPELEHLHIVCHSRGTDVVTTALRELFLEARASGRDPKEVLRIENLVLAAPDMDLDVVTQRAMAERLPYGVGRLTLYSSPNDKALGFADWLFQGVQRLGRLGEADLTPAMKRNLRAATGVDLIRVTAKSGYIGHGYFHSNPSVSSDLILLLRDGRAAGAEHGRPLRPIMQNFWELPTGYPENQESEPPPVPSP